MFLTGRLLSSMWWFRHTMYPRCGSAIPRALLIIIATQNWKSKGNISLLQRFGSPVADIASAYISQLELSYTTMFNCQGSCKIKLVTVQEKGKHILGKWQHLLHQLLAAHCLSDHRDSLLWVCVPYLTHWLWTHRQYFGYC